MKKLALLFILFAVCTAPLIANTPVANSPYALKQISKQISRNMSFPEELKQAVAGCRVKVAFTISNDGKIQIQDMDTDRAALRTFIAEKMEKITLKEVPFDPTQLYLINLKFSILK